eukprot:374438_1
MSSTHILNKRDPRKLYNLNTNSYQDMNNMENIDSRNTINVTESFSPSTSVSASATSLEQLIMGNEEKTVKYSSISAEQQQFNYHYNLLIYMRHPQQHARIAYDAQISAISISIWCIFNMFFGFSITESDTENNNIQNIETLYKRQEIFNNLLVFLIAVLVIHKDIILCNAQLCMPILLIFNFTIRFSIEFLIKLELSWYSVNCVIILLLLWFMCCRFFFNIFKSSTNNNDIHWNLMRCHFFYRGFYIRWISYLIYSWFNSLMVLQLMDSVCLNDGELKTKLCNAHRMKFIGCDMVIVIYCIMVLGIWNRLQYVDTKYLKQYHKLKVTSHGVKELFIFIGVLVIANFLCEGYFTKLVVKKMLTPFTVVLILVSNFLIR